MTNTFRTTYRQLLPSELELVQDIKEESDRLEDLFMLIPAGRCKSIAMTKLEEAVMWAVKGITG